MKNILSKVEFHPLFYFFALLSVLTAHFHDFLSFMIVILFHELGHISGAVFFHWHIKRILILPFGGMTEFQEKLNRPIYQEMIIASLGPIFQMLLYTFYKTPFHYPLLYFNLLPIYPLDGSKFLFLLSNVFVSYYHSYQILFGFSSIVLALLFLSNKTLYAFLFFSYLAVQCFRMKKNISSIFLHFLFERYQHQYSYYRKKKIVGKKLLKMKRSRYHHFFYKGNWHKEEEILQEYFEERQKRERNDKNTYFS